MLRTVRNFSILFIGLLLGACASHMTYSEMTIMMPPQPVDKARIFFYRKDSLVGNLVTPDILIDGKQAGVSNPDTFFYVDTDPGDYEVMCGNGEHNTIHVTVAAGDRAYVRTSVGKSIVKSTMVTERVPLEEAVPEIHELKFAGE
jgi:hypothetical protein